MSDKLDNKICVSIKNRASARVDTIIKSKFQHLSRTEIDYICQNGYATKGSKVLKKGCSVFGDISVVLTKEQRHGLLYKNKSYRLDIAYEDEHVLFINKCSRVPTVANMFLDTDTLSNYVAGYIKTISLGGILNAGSINRLDNDTSGLVLFAKTDVAFEYLYNIYHQNDNDHVEKYYIAFVLDEDKKFPRYVYMKDNLINASREKMAVVNSDNIKNASSEAVVLGYQNQCAILLIRLHTGLRHQIRLQLASRGYAIVGDILYGNSNIENNQRLMLHSYSIVIRHPINEKKMIVSSDFSFMLT